ncbi:hypothetical protein BDW62DRAFT_193538 [Aspergillus aurantiobrunneus]
MQRLLSLIFVVLGVVSSVSAWALTWTNADGNSYVVHRNDPVDCEQIQQSEGQEFRWSPEEDGLSIWLFEDDQCSGFRAGYSPPRVWNRVSSRDLLSFRVAIADENENPPSTLNNNTASSTTASASPTSTESTPTSSATETPTADASDSDGSSVNAGAVAGGVVGGVAGAAAIGGLFFFLGRRRRASRNEPAPPESGPDTETDPSAGPEAASPPAPTPMYSAAAGSAPYDPSSYEGKLELDSAQVYQVDSPVYASDIKRPEMAMTPPEKTTAELPGDQVMAEMSDSHRLNELEGDSTRNR